MATKAARAPASPPKSVTGGWSQAVSSWFVVKRNRSPPGGIAPKSASSRRMKLSAGAPRHTASVADLTGVAKACGIADSRAVTTMAEVESLVPKLHDLKSGPRFANVKIDSANLERILPMRDGIFIVNRIRNSLGFPPI